jgi:steroid delta-isomerase-like uncharacterized protein
MCLMRSSRWPDAARVAIAGMAVAACATTGTPETAMDRAEANKEIVRRVMEEGVNRGDRSVLREALAPDYARHSQATVDMPEIRGRDQMMEFFDATFSAFPDWREEVVLMVAEDDKVAYITRGTGTHAGAFGDVPATGKPVEIMNFIVHRIEDGKIVETWTGWDNLAFLVQVGLFPPGETAGR